MEQYQQEAMAAVGIDVAPPEKPEAVPPHVRNFYRRMMAALDERGIHGDSAPALAMKALAMREAIKPGQGKKFGKRDRQQLKKKLVEEGKLVLHKTRRTTGVPAVIDPRAVDKLIADLPEHAKSSEEAITATIGRLFGYHLPEAQMTASLRAQRFMKNKPGRRLPAHIRSAAVMSTAVMVATVALFPDQADPAAVQATAALRAQFEGTPA